MEQFWNIIHFFAYKFLTKLYVSSLRIAKWYYNTALVKKIFEKNGRNAEIAIKEFKFALIDKRVGQSSFFAYGIMIAMPFVFLCSLHNFYFLIFNNYPTLAMLIYPIVFYGIISGVLNHYLISRHDKYIKYFKKFEKQPREWKVKWVWISAGVILFPFLVLASSFIAMLPK
jgi:hypothetical protein